MAEAARVLLFTHGDAAVTRDATAGLARQLADRGVELVLPDDEAAKHPDLPGATRERPDDADLVLVLGGDGTMLRALQHALGTGTPVVGVNFGTFGFLTTLRADELDQRLGELDPVPPQVLDPFRPLLPLTFS